MDTEIVEREMKLKLEVDYGDMKISTTDILGKSHSGEFPIKVGVTTYEDNREPIIWLSNGDGTEDEDTVALSLSQIKQLVGAAEEAALL